MADEPERPKIIVDEDWKSQAQKEKEQLKKAAESPAGAQQTPHDMPPATFPVLLTMLGTQALVCQSPDWQGGFAPRGGPALH
jgi:hypothetical protein